MRIASKLGRAVLVSQDGTRALDIAKASDGRFGEGPLDVYEAWDDFVAWAATASADDGEPFDLSDLDAPSPAPRQVYAIGLNYRDHADESGFAYPETPVTFTKYVTSFAGPVTDLVLPAETTDWEVELVAVIGRRAEKVSADDAWDHVAGLTVGQDYSERVLQASGPAPQFSLAKSYAGFSPQGPWLVTTDEFDLPASLAISCTINGETVQESVTDRLIFPVADLISWLSHITPLLPGDVIFTGTPSGVGNARDPKWFLKPGDVVVSTIEGIGSLTQTCIAPS